MSTRFVYSTRDLAHAREVLSGLRAAGFRLEQISLVARSDIELERIPDALKEADTDSVPAALRGVGLGGATGLLAGLAAMVFAPVGITVAGAAAIGAIGALVGGWSSALMGSALPDPVRQQFDEEIAAGRLLVLVDADTEQEAVLHRAMQAAQATRLAYESPAGAS